MAQALPAAWIVSVSDNPDATEQWFGFGFTLLAGLLSVLCLPLFPAVGLLGIVGWTANFWLAVALATRLREGLETRLFIAAVLGISCAVAGVAPSGASGTGESQRDGAPRYRGIVMPSIHQRRPT